MITSSDLAIVMQRVTGYADGLTIARVKCAFLLNLLSAKFPQFTEEELMNACDALVFTHSRALMADLLSGILPRKQVTKMAAADQSTVMPLADMAEDDKDITRRLVAFLRPDPLMMIEVEKKHVDTEPSLDVYQVNIEDGRGGSWCEAFPSEQMLRAFLRGIRVTFAMSDLQKLLPDFGDDAPLQFTEQSAVQHLP